jgi:hypothetical protein
VAKPPRLATPPPEHRHGDGSVQGSEHLLTPTPPRICQCLAPGIHSKDLVGRTNSLPYLQIESSFSRSGNETNLERHRDQDAVPEHPSRTAPLAPGSTCTLPKHADYICRINHHRPRHRQRLQRLQQLLRRVCRLWWRECLALYNDSLPREHRSGDFYHCCTNNNSRRCRSV